MAAALHERHGDDFDRILDHRTSSGNPVASRNADDLRRPTPVGSTGINLEKNLNRKQIRQRARFFLDLFGHPPSDLEILYD